MRRRWLCLAASAYTGCALFRMPATEPVPTSAPAELEREWTKYNVYVVERNFEIRTHQELNGYYHGPLSYSTLDYVYKILTPEGAQIATQNLGAARGDGLDQFHVSLEDSAHHAVPLDVNAIRAAFQRTGKLMIPDVTRGCTIRLHFRYGPYTVMDWWEIPFQDNVPVYESRFSIFMASKMGYAFKEYNGLGPPVLETGPFWEWRKWICRDVLPYEPLPFADYASARPRLVMVARKVAEADNAKDWASSLHWVQQQHMGYALLSHVGQCQVKAHALTAAQSDPWDKARLLLDFVRDNVTRVDEGASLFPDRTLEKKQGNEWEIAALLQTMLAADSLDPDIVLSRSRSEGGFDDSFPQPNSLHRPLVTFACRGRRFVAYPARGFSLGDYPPDYFGLPGVSVRRESIEALPSPAHFASSTEIEQTPEDAGGKRAVRIRLQGPIADNLRSRLLDRAPSDRLAEVRTFFHELLGPLRIDAFDVPELTDTEAPLQLLLKTDNPDARIQEAGKNIVIFQEAFSRPFWFYDSTRTDPYFFPAPQHIQDIFHVSAATLSKVITSCAEDSTALFQVHCSVAAEGRNVTVIRAVDIGPGPRTPDALQSVSAEIAKLDDGFLQTSD